MRRKLAVILASDVAGYSRLVALDEETTVVRFNKLRAALEELATGYHGRVFNTAGDAILIEFDSATDAVRCAIEFQELARGRSRAFPASQAMLFRIGIAIGDVLVQQDGDLLGDGVNLAARLQGIAMPGGVVLSQDVQSHVERNLSVAAVDLGPQDLKNLTRPVHAYALALPDAAPVAVATAEAEPLRVEPRQRKRRSGFGPNPLLIGVSLLAIMGVGGWWYIGQKPQPAPSTPPQQQASKPPVAPPTTPPTTPQQQTAQPPAEVLGPNTPDGWTPTDPMAEKKAALSAELGKAGLPAAVGDAGEIAEDYLREEPYKALAVASGSGLWQVRRALSERDATMAALEACHLTYGKPCVLLARGENVLSDSEEQRRTPQVMPRLIYAGAFDPARIPIIGPNLRGRADVAGYANAAGPKAMALHPLGRISVATAGTVQEAETKALAQCDALGSVSVEGPCRTYALDNEVVLPQRRSLVRQ